MALTPGIPLRDSRTCLPLQNRFTSCKDCLPGCSQPVQERGTPRTALHIMMCPALHINSWEPFLRTDCKPESQLVCYSGLFTPILEEGDNARRAEGSPRALGSPCETRTQHKRFTLGGKIPAVPQKPAMRGSSTTWCSDPGPGVSCNESNVLIRFCFKASTSGRIDAIKVTSFKSKAKNYRQEVITETEW